MLISFGTKFVIALFNFQMFKVKRKHVWHILDGKKIDIRYTQKYETERGTSEIRAKTRRR